MREKYVLIFCSRLSYVLIRGVGMKFYCIYTNHIFNFMTNYKKPSFDMNVRVVAVALLGNRNLTSHNSSIVVYVS